METDRTILASKEHMASCSESLNSIYHGIVKSWNVDILLTNTRLGYVRIHSC